MADEADSQLMTEVMITKAEVEWKIHDFSKLDAAGRVTDKITVGGYVWCFTLCVFPSSAERSVDSLSMCLQRRSSKSCKKSMTVDVSYCLVSSNPQIQFAHKYRENNRPTEVEVLMSEVKDPARGYLVNDTLTMKAVITLNDEHAEDARLPMQQQHLVRHLELLHEDSSMSDVQVEVGESVFLAHKVVLAQAPFFRSCISSEIGKSTTSNSSTSCVVKLQEEEVSADAFRVVLEFLYKVAKEPELPKGRALLDVHSAARYLMLPELEAICRFAFTKALSMEVLVPFLCYSNMHDLSSMKKACLDFALESEVRLSDFMLTTDFMTLATDHRELYVELIKCFRDTVVTTRKRKAEELLDE